MFWSTARERLLRPRGCGLVVWLMTLPGAASACPNCYGSSDDRVLTTYYFSTLMLSCLPFVIGAVGAAVFVFVRNRSSEGSGATPISDSVDLIR